MRVGALVDTDGGARLLIDTPPELRLQLLAAGVTRIDGVLFTHDHADHTHGLDDIRAITVRRATHLPMYGSAATLAALARKFPYIFDDSPPPPGSSKPRGVVHPLDPGHAVRIADVDVTPVEVAHGRETVFAYRIGPLAYVTDAKAIPAAARQVLSGARVLVLNALLRTEHPTHLSIAEAVRLAGELGAERTFLTHLTHDNFHAALEAELPATIRPAYDGLVVEVDE